MKFREELLRIVEPTRAEVGCLTINAFESLREPVVFAIHSEWVDEATFDLHAQSPHTVRFLEAALVVDPSRARVKGAGDRRRRGGGTGG